MNILFVVRPYPGWDKFRFNLSTGAVEVPDDTAPGLSAFGEGTWVLNPSDRAALDAALAGRGPGAGGDAAAPHSIAVALAGEDPTIAEAALREALARGADRAWLIGGAADADSYFTASILAAVVRRQPAAEAIDLVVLGAETPAGGPDEIGPMLAEALGWAGITTATTLAWAPDGAGLLRAEQRGPGGPRTVQAAGPAVVSVAANPALPPRYAHGGAVIAAYRQRTVETLALATLGLAGAGAERSAPRVVVRRAALADSPPNERLTGPIDESVAVLLPALRALRGTE